MSLKPPTLGELKKLYYVKLCRANPPETYEELVALRIQADEWAKQIGVNRETET